MFAMIMPLNFKIPIAVNAQSENKTSLQNQTDRTGNFALAPKVILGDQGERGPKGDKGDKGQTGPQGNTGQQGELGPANVNLYQKNGFVYIGTGVVKSEATCDQGDESIKGLSNIQIISGAQPHTTITGSATTANWMTLVNGTGEYRIHSIVFCFDNL